MIHTEEQVLSRYEHYRLGHNVVRIAYNQHDDPFMAETPSPKDGSLTIDNRLILRILLEDPDDLEEISEEKFSELLKKFS